MSITLDKDIFGEGSRYKINIPEPLNSAPPSFEKEDAVYDVPVSGIVTYPTYKKVKNNYVIFYCVILAVVIVIIFLFIFFLYRSNPQPNGVIPSNNINNAPSGFSNIPTLKGFYFDIERDDTKMSSRANYVNSSECSGKNRINENCQCNSPWIGPFCSFLDMRNLKNVVCIASTNADFSSSSIGELTVDEITSEQVILDKMNELNSSAFIVDHNQNKIIFLSNLNVDKEKIYPISTFVAGPHIYGINNPEILINNDYAIISFNPNASLYDLITQQNGTHFLYEGEVFTINPNIFFKIYSDPTKFNTVITTTATSEQITVTSSNFGFKSALKTSVLFYKY